MKRKRYRPVPTREALLGGKIKLYGGDCRDALKLLTDNSIDSGVTDPPYHLLTTTKRFANSDPAREHYAMSPESAPFGRLSRGFMGQRWDGGDIAFDPKLWKEVYRVLKPGAHLLAMGGTRTFHRLVSAIEDAGFEIRDTILWLYGEGFPKSHDVSKHIDAKLKHGKSNTRMLRKINETRPGEGKIGGRLPNAGIMSGNIRAAAVSRDQPITPQAAQWSGWGTALKPSCELICLARKPLIGTVATNVLKHGTGALNIDACRVAATDQEDSKPGNGRWPSNLIHDGSPDVVARFPNAPGQQAAVTGREPSSTTRNVFAPYNERATSVPRNDSGSAARFYYCSKADVDDRLAFKHPTVKPLDLMQYLIRLVTPPGGTVLDPFAGTGTTGEAAAREGMRAVLVEKEREYQGYIRERMRIAGAPQQHRNAIRNAQAERNEPRRSDQIL
jgi:site-specific DNA-methyltransferase (adenine-specific)